MTYNTQRIFANFLNNEEGMLSKNFIELCHTFYGKSLGKRAFISAMRTASIYNRPSILLNDPVIVLPKTPETQAVDLQQLAYDWFPGSLELLSRTAAQTRTPHFHVYHAKRYNQSNDVEQLSVDDCIAIVMAETGYTGELDSLFTSVSVGDTTPTHLRKLLKTLLFERVYDSVSAQVYNRPANASSLREYYMSLMRGNPEFNYAKWVEEDGFLSRINLWSRVEDGGFSRMVNSATL